VDENSEAAAAAAAVANVASGLTAPSDGGSGGGGGGGGGDGGGFVKTKFAPAPNTKPNAATVTATSAHTSPPLVCQKPLSVRPIRSGSQGPSTCVVLTQLATIVMEEGRWVVWEAEATIVPPPATTARRTCCTAGMHERRQVVARDKRGRRIQVTHDTHHAPDVAPLAASSPYERPPRAPCWL